MNRRHRIGSAACALVAATAFAAAQPRHLSHRFDDPEQFARSFDDPERDEWQMPGRVIAELGIEDGDAVADIGAGTGYFTVRLARATPARVVYAVDIEPTMVEWVEKRAAGMGLSRVKGVLAAADDANLPEPVDVVLIVNTWHHIPNRTAYVSRLAGKMAPGGRLAIVDLRKGAPGAGPPDHFRFTPEEIGAELEPAGYELLASHEFLPRQHFLIYRAPERDRP